MKEYWFFFDKDGMPIAVFYTLCKGDAFDLFARLYRRVWSESVKLGITIEREEDVAAERWDEIHRKYIKAAQPKPAPTPVILKPATAIKLGEHKQRMTTGLESEKYMSRM